MSTRSPALPPEERRAEIAAATIPLLEAHGSDVTTRQIAEAAGVAEGTLFRAFPGKEAIIQAAVEAALDPAALRAALEAIDAGLPLEDRLRAAVHVLQARVARIWRLVAGVGAGRLSPRRKPPDLSALAEVLAPDAGRLRHDPRRTAQLVWAVTVAGTHPVLSAGDPLDPDEVVDVLLHGLLGGAPGEGPC